MRLVQLVGPRIVEGEFSRTRIGKAFQYTSAVVPASRLPYAGGPEEGVSDVTTPQFVR